MRSLIRRPSANVDGIAKDTNIRTVSRNMNMNGIHHRQRALNCFVGLVHICTQL